MVLDKSMHILQIEGKEIGYVEHGVMIIVGAGFIYRLGFLVVCSIMS